MDQINGRDARKREQFERLAKGLANGLFVVDAQGDVLCVLQDVTNQQDSRGKILAAIEALIPEMNEDGHAIATHFRDGRHRSETQLSSLDQLTEREREVLGLICQGQDDRAMSRALGLSRNTIRNHVASLYRKIGVNRRGAAIIWARERGITSDEALKPRPRQSVRARRKDTRH